MLTEKQVFAIQLALPQATLQLYAVLFGKLVAFLILINESFLIGMGKAVVKQVTPVNLMARHFPAQVAHCPGYLLPYTLVGIDFTSTTYLGVNYSIGPIISSGRTHRSNSSAVTYPRRTASSFSVVPFR
ncbi:MAG: hypothetical protein XE13_0237 [Proteiniphilum sp. 51_7]|nr:MAG: hypothetical protein XE13_0237 [Proteiniphilum sp. 51_7]